LVAVGRRDIDADQISGSAQKISENLAKIAPDQCLRNSSGAIALQCRNPLGCIGQLLRRFDEGTMNRLTISALLGACAMVATAPAHAGDAEGKLQVKLLATGVLPDGKITSVDDPLGILTPADQTRLNDNIVPTLAIEYYASPNISIETICCVTTHGVSGSAGAIDGEPIVDHVMVLPATITLKYHFDAGAIKPYIGAGPALFFYIDEKPGALAQSLLVDRIKLDNKAGVAVQAGFDVPVNDNGMGISFDAKKYWVKTTAHYFVGATEALATTHKVDPWVISGGVYFRF
jgi:outer membrane protein